MQLVFPSHSARISKFEILTRSVHVLYYTSPKYSEKPLLEWKHHAIYQSSNTFLFEYSNASQIPICHIIELILAGKTVYYVLQNIHYVLLLFGKSVHFILQNGNNQINLTVHNTDMSLSDAVEASPRQVLGSGIVLLRLIKEFDYEEMQLVELVVKFNCKLYMH